MRDLHVVALSEDGQHVVLATRPGIDVGEFRVALDDRLTAAVRGELPRPGASAPPHVTPKEIQARLRSGESVEQIAASAGVPVSRVERFAGPVLSELDRVITGARDAVVTRARRGPSDLPLGRAVDQRLAEVSGLQPGSTVWSARRDGPGRWLVEVTWTARARVRTAGWSYEPATRQVTPVDAPSAALGHVDLSEAASDRPARAPAGRAVAPAPARATAGTAASRGPVKDKAGVRAGAPAKANAPAKAKAPAKVGRAAAQGKAAAQGRAPAKARTAAPAARTAAAATRASGSAQGTRAQPAPRTRSAATPAPAARPAAGSAAARTRPAPAASSAGTRTPAARPAAARPAPAARRAAPAAGPAPEVRPGPPLLRVVPPVEDHPGADAPGTTATPPTRPATRPASDAPPAAPARVRRAAGQRASVPDWADVLLGTASAPLPSAGEGPERSS